MLNKERLFKAEREGTQQEVAGWLMIRHTGTPPKDKHGSAARVIVSKPLTTTQMLA